MSVVIPTKDRPTLLSNALRSVAEQTYPNLEVIVVDDGSDPPVSFEPGPNTEGIQVIRLSPSMGPAAARNEGVERATGSFLAFLDDDDEWLPDKTERQLDVLLSQGPEVAGVESGEEAWEDGRLVYRYTPRPDRDLRLELLKRPTLGPPHVILRKEVFTEAGGFDPTLKRGEDWDLWLRLVDRYQIVALPEVHLRRRLHRYPPKERVIFEKIMFARLEPRIRELPAAQRRRLLWHHRLTLTIRRMEAVVTALLGPRAWTLLKRLKGSWGFPK